MIYQKLNYKIAVWGIFLLFITSSCTTFDAFMAGRKKSINKVKTPFYIRSNYSINQLVDSLKSQGIISNKNNFKTVLEYKGLTKEEIGAGKYIIAPQTKYKTLINGFTKNRLGNGNKEKEVRVTFNNCRDIYELAGDVSKQLEVDSAELVHYLLSDSILSKYGFNTATIPALFLPNTYRFYWDTDAKGFTAKMATAFREFWTPIRLEKLKEIGLKNQSDAVTLASIVYKEQSQRPVEWKTIAGLYLNRLHRGMKLQSDPTFRFCWGDKLEGKERLTYADRAIDCPYNTYIYAGLPPGPICIPPINTIKAVLNPEANDYLFMCAKPGGKGLHNFAKTLRQHNINARKYHKWLRNR